MLPYRFGFGVCLRSLGPDEDEGTERVFFLRMHDDQRGVCGVYDVFFEAVSFGLLRGAVVLNLRVSFVVRFGNK
jgi:hypothetical protein